MHNGDIVSNMVNEMGLTPARADYLQGQQNAPPQMMQPGYPDSQLQMMDNMAAQEPLPMQQQQQQMPMQQQNQQQYMPPYEDEEESNMSYDLEPEKPLPPASWLDTLIMYLKTPSIVAFIFLIFTLPYTSTLIAQILPQFLVSSSTYFLLMKTILVGISFSLVHLLIE